MSRGYDRPLYILASDHRTSFHTELFRIDGAPSDAERRKMAEAKRIILQGLRSVAETAEAGTIGALMDEEHGASAARAAKASGLLLALSAEKSSQAEFELEYGDEFADHIAAFDPGFVKVLVRYNVDGFIGFAIGRTIFWEPLSQWIDGSIDGDAAALIIADNYRRTIDLYTSAAQAA